IYKIIEKVAATPSRNEKEAILKQHAGNDLLKEVIRLAYDPFTNFWIRKIPVYKPDDESNETLENAIKLLSVLSTRERTGNSAIEWLINLLSCVSSNDAIIIERIIGRDLRAGFTAGTANKIWPKLIMEYPCMLCAQMDDKILAKMRWPAIFQMKMDGMRFNAIVIDGKIEYRSRNGKLIELFGILDSDFIKMSEGKNVVFDGELLIHDENGVPLPRTTGNGILQRAVKGKSSKEDLLGVAAVLWDRIDYEWFIRGTFPHPYYVRLNWLIAAFLQRDSDRISIVDSHEVANMEEAQVIYNEYLKQGQEGGILKSLDGMWKDSRSSDQIKMKAELECDLLCTGVYYGKKGTKYETMLGGIELQSADGIIKVNCGSGFNDDQRDMENIDDCLGKIQAIKYNARIKDKRTGQEILFLPVWVEVRLDKTDADKAKDIK